MTKPIEGWVIINNDNNGEANRYTSEHVGGDYIEVFTSEEGALDVSGDGETVRSVLVTFTDELDTVVKYKRLEELRNEKDIPQPVVEKEIADAIRKDREMIWDKIQDIDLRIPDWVSLQRAIFGEEK